jgi:hypothetical protein
LTIYSPHILNEFTNISSKLKQTELINPRNRQFKKLENNYYKRKAFKVHLLRGNVEDKINLLSSDLFLIYIPAICCKTFVTLVWFETNDSFKIHV